MTVMWRADNPGTGCEWEMSEKAIPEIQLRDLEDGLVRRELVRVWDALDVRPAKIAHGWDVRGEEREVKHPCSWSGQKNWQSRQIQALVPLPYQQRDLVQHFSLFDSPSSL